MTYAPILLVPVEIIRKTAKKEYIIRGRVEETIINITLLEIIRHEFGIAIGGLESLPRDESGPAALNLPINHDSSQLEAIVNASRGKSFVLHGPQCTGKSQTITNIIVSALFTPGKAKNCKTGICCEGSRITG